MISKEFGEKAKLITVILQKGTGKDLLEFLFEKGITRANVSFARKIMDDSDFKLGEQNVREILKVAVPASKADEVFEDIYFKTECDTVPGTFVYMTNLTVSSFFELPELQHKE
jgi:hypothetical protein